MLWKVAITAYGAGGHVTIVTSLSQVPSSVPRFSRCAGGPKPRAVVPRQREHGGERRTPEIQSKQSRLSLQLPFTSCRDLVRSDRTHRDDAPRGDRKSGVTAETQGMKGVVHLAPKTLDTGTLMSLGAGAVDSHLQDSAFAVGVRRGRVLEY